MWHNLTGEIARTRALPLKAKVQMSQALQISLLLSALLCSLAYWVVWASHDQISLTGAAFKTAATALLAILALGEGAGSSFLIALGMALGAGGDFALTRRGQTAFLLGMAAFAAGHLGYVAAFWLRAQSIAANAQAPALSGFDLAALIGLAALVLSTEVWLAPRTGALRWPVRGYVLVIGLMGGAAILLPPHPENAGAGVLQTGAMLFILSDLLLALRLFVFPKGRPARALSLTLWPAYWLGQALILAGAVLYWLPFGL